MADKARWYNTKLHDYKPVSIDDISILNFASNEKFKCINPSCNVDMFLRNSSNGNFSFVSKPGQASKHVDAINCIRSSLSFQASKYCEEKFSFNNFINNLRNKKSKAPSGRGTVSTSKEEQIKVDSKPPIRGLSSFYRLVLEKDKNEFYNKIRIGDMFCDQENCKDFVENPNGYKVLECSYYCPICGRKLNKMDKILLSNFSYKNDFINSSNMLSDEDL